MKTTTAVPVEKVAEKEPVAGTPEAGTPEAGKSEMSSSQLAEWIRQNFFGELSDSEFGKHLEEAKKTYVRVKTYLETHELSFSLNTLNALKELIINDEAPSKEVKEEYGTPTGTTAKAEEAHLPASLDSLEEQLRSIEKKAFWALIILIIILFIK